MDRGSGVNKGGLAPFSILLIASLLFYGCGGKNDAGPEATPGAGPQTAPVTLAISVPGLSKPTGSGLMAPAPVAVNSIRVTVSASDISPSITRLLVRGTDFSATTDPVIVTLQVPTGTGRTFTAAAFASNDGTGVPPLFQGATTGVAVTSSGLNQVTIILFSPPFAQPTITSFDPTSGCPGISIVITGTNFDPIPANNGVVFVGSSNSADNRRANVTGATPTQLTVTVPDGAATGPISVTTFIGGVSAGSFTVLNCSASTLLFGTKLNLSNNAGSSGKPSVAVSGTTVIAAWHDNTLGNTGILVARSTDGGVNFGPPVNISNNAGFSLIPSVAISGTTVIAAWQDTTPGNDDILVARFE